LTAFSLFAALVESNSRALWGVFGGRRPKVRGISICLTWPQGVAGGAGGRKGKPIAARPS